MVRQALRADLPRVVETWVDAFSCFERGHTFVGDDVAVAWIPPDLALVDPDGLVTLRPMERPPGPGSSAT